MYLILFLGGSLLFALLLIKATEKGKMKKYAKFLDAVTAGVAAVVPEAVDFDTVMAQGAKDAISTIKGYERIQTGYDSLPHFIVRYREDELFIMAVPCPSVSSMEVDTEFVMHITKDMLKEVKFGALGKVSFYFKDSSRFLAMTVTDYAIPLVMQHGENVKFKAYIKEFAKRVNGCLLEAAGPQGRA